MLKKVGGCLICKKGLRLYHRIIQTRGTGCNNPLTVKPCNNFPGLPSETSDADLNDKTPGPGCSKTGQRYPPDKSLSSE